MVDHMFKRSIWGPFGTIKQGKMKVDQVFAEMMIAKKVDA